jgi:hypothetical protein
VAPQQRNVPTPRTMRLVVLAPIGGVILCAIWSYVAWHVIPLDRALRDPDAQRRALFWANDLPFWLFGVPVVLVGAAAVIHAVRSRQGWLCVLLVLYYSPLLVVALMACILFTPFKLPGW